MQWLKLVVVAMLVWGNSAFARLPETNVNSDQQLQTISSWMAHLNFYYPSLNVAVSDSDLQNPAMQSELFNELQTLENVMHGDQILPPPSLKNIACANPVCDGGGDGGKCHACKSGN